MASMIGLDILAPGTSRKAVDLALRGMSRLGPAAARAAPAIGRAVLPPISGPAALAAGYYYTAEAAMDQARRDAEQFGEPRIPIPIYNPILGDMPTVAVPDVTPVKRAVRKASKFNKAISAGMKAVRSSKFMGKKGNISNSKRAFATVTKTVSGLKKGRKRPTKGVRGAIARAARRYI